MEFNASNVLHAKKQLERAVMAYKADTDEASLKCYATIALYHEIFDKALHSAYTNLKEQNHD